MSNAFVMTEEEGAGFGVPFSWSRGQAVLHATPENYLGLIQRLKDAGFNGAVDLCGADYLAHPGRTLPPEVVPQRFEVAVNLISYSRRQRVRVRAQVPADRPVLPSLFSLYPGTEAMEREAYDMFGISFSDHPDLTRILMPEDWEGHPLRKDYAVGRVPVQFKHPPSTR